MKALRILSALVIFLTVFGGSAFAEPEGPPGSWVTDFTVLNLENSPAALGVTRYVRCTTPGCAADPGATVANTTVPANGSYYYNPALDPAFPSPFAGSIVLSSDKLIAATVTVANTATGSAYASDAYAGISEVSTSVFLPIIMGNLGPWSTQIAVQNAGGSNANVTIDYIGPGAPGDSTINNLPPNMTAIVDQQSIPGLSNFNGAAIVTSSQPVAIEVDEYKSSGGVLVSYTGVPLSQANSTVYMPGFIAQGQWATDFTIVNTEGSSADVQVSFVGSGNTLSGSIPANGSAYVNGYAGVIPAGWTGAPPVSGYYGAATVTSTNGKKLVVVYNIANSAGGPGNYAIGYVGFPSTKGAKKVAVPLIENHYSTGWDTTFSVQNIEGGTANLSMVYSGNLAPNCNPCTYPMTSASHTFNQVTDGHVPAGFLGGVTITSDKNIVVIADQNKTGAQGDTAAGFPGIPVPAP
jgi:hypothetical protein